MTKEAQKKIWRNLWTVFALGCAAIIVGITIKVVGMERQLFLLLLCAFVLGVLAIGMSTVKMIKFRKFLKTLED